MAEETNPIPEREGASTPTGAVAPSVPRELLAGASADDPGWRAALAKVGPRTLLAFDYDGTLAPLVPDIGEAWMTDSTRTAMARLLGVAGARVAIVSGRESDDVRHYFAPLEPLTPGFVVGNHGADHVDPEDVAPQLLAFRPILEAAVARVPGAELEPKSMGFSLHWRKSADPAAAERVLGEAVRSLEDAVVIGGKHVFNVLPKGAPHKGEALARLAAEHDFDHVLFVGDDVTDELAFGHAYEVPFTGIRVSDPPPGGTRAEFLLREQSGVDTLLRNLGEILVDAAASGRR